MILQILRSSKQPLAKYDLYLQIHGLKGWRGVTSKTVYRRVDHLTGGGLIIENGKRPGKVQGESVLYRLTEKGKASLRLDKNNIEEFLEKATETQLLMFNGLFDAAFGA